MGSFQGGDRSLSVLERILRGSAIRARDGLIIGSRSEAKRVRSRYRFTPEKTVRIFNPLDTRTWMPKPRGEARTALGIPPDAQVVTWHGRVEIRRKGLDVLLDAWARVCGEKPETDVRLLLVGSGNDVRELDRLIADRALRGVHWLKDTFVTVARFGTIFRLLTYMCLHLASRGFPSRQSKPWPAVSPS